MTGLTQAVSFINEKQGNGETINILNETEEVVKTDDIISAEIKIDIDFE